MTLLRRLFKWECCLLIMALFFLVGCVENEELIAAIENCNTSPEFNFEVIDKTHEPLIKPTKPWESILIGYSTVLKYNGKWYAWYEAYDEGAKDDYSSYLCLAISENGTDWEKPSFGIEKYKDSLESNILIKGKNVGGIHGASVFIDTSAPRNERFKMVFSSRKVYGKEDEYFISGATSPDGIHWSKSFPLLEHYSDTQNVCFFDNGVYKLYFRSWIGEAGIGERIVSYSESNKFSRFSFNAKDNILRQNITRDIYTNSTVKFNEALYFMMLSEFNKQEDRVQPLLAYSQDGKRFCFYDGENWLLNSSGFDSGQIYISPSIIQSSIANEFYIYYSGISKVHSENYTTSSTDYGLGRFRVRINERSIQ